MTAESVTAEAAPAEALPAEAASPAEADPAEAAGQAARQPVAPSGRRRLREAAQAAFGDVGLVATREITERVRGRIFRVGTIVMLAVIAAAIIIPSIHRGQSGETRQTVAVVGELTTTTRQIVKAAGQASKDSVTIVHVPSLDAAKAGLKSGALDMAVVDGRSVLLYLPAAAAASPADPTLVANLASYLGVVRAYGEAGLTAAQAKDVSQAKPVPVVTFAPGAKQSTRAPSVVGLVLLFFMLTQYNTWILIGVMQEKSSRVVEVLLATVRPIQLLGGKVLGIGLVAIGQAALLVVFALALGKAVGSDLLHGAQPLVFACELLWLLLGYAFYCWVYAAAGSTAERQDQVQTLAIPLSIPILIGYIYAITVASSGNASLLFRILAYFPPTAPFCMPVLVGLDLVSWWQFLASVAITLAATAAMAVFAARIYRRAVLQTGARVSLIQVVRQSVSS